MSDSETHENPRTVRVRKVILDAAIELLVRGGASDVTAARIADETGVARTTIYRQWPDQPALLLATIDALVTPHRPQTTTGDLRRDLVNSLSNLRTRLVTKAVRPVFAALADYAMRDGAFSDAERRFTVGMIQPTADVIEAAHKRGELPTVLDPVVAATTLTGPLFQQFLMMWDTIEDAFIDAVVDQFLAQHQRC